MRRSILVVLIIPVFVLAGRYGWGGFEFVYIPGGEVIDGVYNIPNPVFDVRDFWDGVPCSGGSGFGGVPDMGYFGGGGFGGYRELVVDQDGTDVTYRVSVGGGYGGYGRAVHIGPVSINAFLGLGSLSFGIERKVNSGNTSLEDLENGVLEGYLGAGIDYIAVFPKLTFTIELVKGFFQIDLGVIGILGYSFGGWRVEDDLLEGAQNLNRFYFGYGLFLGVAFGS